MNGGTNDARGAFKQTQSANMRLGSGSDIAAYGYGRTDTFNANRSNAIYGASATVQPPAISLIPQIRY